MKKRSAGTLLSATATVRVVVVNVNYLCEPPLSLRRREGGFLLSKTFFRKKKAAVSRTIPLRISRSMSRNVSMIITSLSKRKRRATTTHPNNIQLQLYPIIIPLSNKLTTFDKIRGVPSTAIRLIY